MRIDDDFLRIIIPALNGLVYDVDFKVVNSGEKTNSLIIWVYLYDIIVSKSVRTTEDGY